MNITCHCITCGKLAFVKEIKIDGLEIKYILDCGHFHIQYAHRNYWGSDKIK
jgi:hypothetical protein